MEETLNMSKRHEPHQATQQSSWLEDQLTKSLFFHIKLHEWMLLETAEQLEQLRGDQLDWTISNSWVYREGHGTKSFTAVSNP
jgi:hypothetical protein